MINEEEVKEIIKNFLEKLTVQFDEIEILEDDTHPTISIKTEDSGVLIGNNGETLRALNHIVKRIIGKKKVEKYFPLSFQRKR